MSLAAVITDRSTEAASPALAAAPAPYPVERRGALRPPNLTPARMRIRGRVLWRAYRAVDGLLIAGLAALAALNAYPHRMWSGSVPGVICFVLAAALLAGGLESIGAYQFRGRESLAGHLVRLGAGLGLFALVLSGVLLLTHPQPRVAGSMLAWFSCSATGLTALHIGWWRNVRGLRAAGRLTPNIVIVGATANARRLIEKALESEEVAVLGVFDDRRGRAPAAILGVPVLGDTSDLLGHRIMPYVDRVVITVTASAHARIRQLTDQLHELPNEISLMLEVDRPTGADGALARLADASLARLSGAPIDDGKALIKRIQDIVLGALALTIVSPIMFAVALAIKLDSPGPVFFRQRRQGFNNEDIMVWKFRSLRHDLRDEAGRRQVTPDDPRVTRVGRFIRLCSLDELPQLFNVLAGEMSLVGPRPHAPRMRTGAIETARLVGEYAHRHRLKPGMTGWAAIQGSLGPLNRPEDVRRRVALDIDYIERQSSWLDLYILLMTPACLIRAAGVAR